MVQFFPFDLAFHPKDEGLPLYAVFPFIFDGVPVQEISCALSSRLAGDMTYSEQNLARSALFGAMGLNSQMVYGLEQIHSQEVLAVSRRNPPATPADGMVSDDRQIALSVTVADCLPLYLFDTESGAFGLVHSGWKGTGIVLRALELMRERWRTRPEALAALMGPCIGPCCYRVNGERADAFEKEFGVTQKEISAGALPGPVTRQDSAGYYLDLKAANAGLLARAGVRNIAVCRNCTFTDKRLGSYRREGAQQYTRMAAVLMVSQNI
jgi:YfiH family protein